MYHYITVDIVMRDCDSPVDAVRRLNSLMPQNPDETTQHMESWSVEQVWSMNSPTISRDENEAELERLVAEAEGRGA
jgi:hypothetical protein